MTCIQTENNEYFTFGKCQTAVDYVSYIKRQAYDPDNNLGNMKNNNYGIGIHFENQYEKNLLINFLQKFEETRIKEFRFQYHIKGDHPHEDALTQLIIRPNLSIVEEQNSPNFLEGSRESLVGLYSSDKIISLIEFLFSNHINFGGIFENKIF